MADDQPPRIAGSFLSGSGQALKKDQLATYAAVLKDHGGRRVRFRVGPPKIGFLFDAVFRPEDARQVLATEAAQYDKEVPGIDELRRLFGNGLLFSGGERWRRDRRIVAPLFTKRRITSYVGGMAVAADRLVATWAAAEGGKVDLSEAGSHYALDVLGRSVFGRDVESAAPVLRSTVPVLDAFGAQRVLSPVRLPAWVPRARNRRADRARRELWGLVDGLIAERRAGPLDGPLDGPMDGPMGGPMGGEDLLSLLLTARDPDDGTALSDVAVREQALILLVGGHETTASTMALTLHLVGRHPEVQQRIREEVAAVVGSRPVAVGDLGGLTYTAQVVDETLRLYPPGHTLVRHAHKPTTLDGQEVPPGHLVAVSIWGVHHNPAVWPDPERFDPDRFGSGDIGRYAHVPFGGGPRGCIGQHLATAELVVAVATLVRAFRLESELEEPVLDVAVSLRPKGALPCRVTPA